MNSMESRDSFAKCSAILDRADQVLLFITGIVLLGLTFMIFIDISLRFLFNSPLPASAESTELMMPYIAFCALAYTLAKGRHIRITLLFDRVPKKINMIFEMFSSLTGAVFCGLLTVWSWSFFWNSFIIREEMLAIIKLPWWTGKFAMPLGFAFITLRFLFNILSELRAWSDISE